MYRMSLSHKHASRNCIRCSKELTDAASMEVGVGPICRKLDSKLLAQQINSNTAMARASIMEIDVEQLELESRNTFREVLGAINTPYADTVTDWRKTVKRIEWLLSFPQNVASSRRILTSTVHALGYVGLAAMWEGIASSGAATVTFLNDRLHISGPRNADFRAAIKRVGSCRFHAATGNDAATWSLPMTHDAEFRKLVQTYYPNHDEAQLNAACAAANMASAKVKASLETARHLAAAQAARTASQQAAVTVAINPPPPMRMPDMSKVRIERQQEFGKDTNWVKVYTPFNREFVDHLKQQIVWTNRRWNPNEKCWEVNTAAFDTLGTLIETHYGERVTLPPKTSYSETPVQIPYGTLPF